MDNWLKKHLTSPLVCYFGSGKAKRHFSKAPVLIGGCGRSGTTLLLAILSAHPRIFVFPEETDAFTQWKNGKPLRIDRMYRLLLTRKIPETVWRWCEKRPSNVRQIEQILHYFGPEARFIHLVRDPRAVCTSVHPQNPGEYWIPVERYVNDVNAGLVFRDHPQVLTVKYETLVLQTEQCIRELCDFLGEEPVTEIHNWYDRATVRSDRAWFQGLQEIHTASLDRWKLPEHEKRINEILERTEIRDLMERLEYAY